MGTLNTSNNEKNIEFIVSIIILFIIMSTMVFMIYLGLSSARKEIYEREKRESQKREELLQLPIKVENGYIKLYTYYNMNKTAIKIDNIVSINEYNDDSVLIITNDDPGYYEKNNRYICIGRIDNILPIIDK